MSGGKGGSTTSKVEIPAWAEQAAQQNLAKANELAQIGYTPYYGPDIAAQTPLQQSAIGNLGAAAGAYGLGAPTSATAGMPQATTYANGMQGYSSGSLYDQAVAELQARRPAQYNALNAPFINPVTGEAPKSPYANYQTPEQIAAANAPAPAPTYGGDNGSAQDWLDQYGGNDNGPDYSGMSDYDRAYAEQMDLMNSWDANGATLGTGYGNTPGQATANARDSMGGGK